MKLLFKGETIGSIIHTKKEHCWEYGIFKGNENFKKYKDFFEGIVREETFDEINYDCELINDDNWEVKKNGEIRGIYIPAIYIDGDIEFRYR